MRLVEYSPGYVADHWCQKGHILFCMDGELGTELADDRWFTLRPGMSYQVADGAEAHRSRTEKGAQGLREAAPKRVEFADLGCVRSPRLGDNTRPQNG